MFLELEPSICYNQNGGGRSSEDRAREIQLPPSESGIVLPRNCAQFIEAA